jgi:hypothetical protein
MATFEEIARSAITSALDITNKLTSAKSADTFPHLNDDVPLGNYNPADEWSIKVNFTLFRISRSMGANSSCLLFLAEADEIVNISRGRMGFQNRILRSNITQSASTVRDDSPSPFSFGRPASRDQF